MGESQSVQGACRIFFIHPGSAGERKQVTFVFRVSKHDQNFTATSLHKYDGNLKPALIPGCQVLLFCHLPWHTTVKFRHKKYLTFGTTSVTHGFTCKVKASLQDRCSVFHFYVKVKDFRPNLTHHIEGLAYTLNLATQAGLGEPWVSCLQGPVSRVLLSLWKSHHFGCVMKKKQLWLSSCFWRIWLNKSWL